MRPPWCAAAPHAPNRARPHRPLHRATPCYKCGAHTIRLACSLRAVGLRAQVLCFFSRGYFLSANSMREVRAAIEFNKPMIAVHEEDISHGGGENRARCWRLL